MKKIALATTALFMLSAGAASAADLAARPYTKAPAPIAAVYNWTGLYIGINGGGGSSRWGLDNFGHFNATGGTVGGQIGYRWQAANWVFGLEGQGNWADFSRSETITDGITALRADLKTNAFGLLTAQAGYAWNNVLLYVKGGAAVVNNKATLTVTDIRTATSVIASESETRWGGTVGAGLEFGFTPNWSLGLEYNHIFVSHDNSLANRNLNQDIDMGLVRVNYRFGGPVVARY
jgi:outer membrane immunogenic protein